MSQSPVQEQPAKDPLAPNVEDLYLESYAFTTAAAIVGSVDRKIFVVLRDGRNVFGILRTFDQFANLVLQDTIERIYLDSEKKRFGETYRGVFMIRGENVVMMGELDIDREDDHLHEWQQIPFPEAEKELHSVQAQRIKDQKVKAKNLLAKGLIDDFSRSDLY
ncbi:sm-like protein LSm1 [[Candida] anglica]|uniref:U6 snRNA-associated Sm-like protein LSm1 n=1 Tax=[Candida] anglica TaxID=148631 RepID=A0ABP0ELD8_9ASCO